MKTVLSVIILVLIISIPSFSQGVKPPGDDSQYGDNVQFSSGTASIPLLNGIHTVTFSNGAVYTGTFENNRPTSCIGTYVLNGIQISGYFQAVDERTVQINQGGYSVTITIDPRYITTQNNPR